MTEVTGPISTLPGNRHTLPEGAKCDKHPERLAKARVQGETDSFGAELNDLCEECLEELKAAGPTIGTCDWCKAPEIELKPRRDWEEGSYGRVYDVCSKCIATENKNLQEELDRQESFGYDNDEGDF